jgi:hypothetical protein
VKHLTNYYKSPSFEARSQNNLENQLLPSQSLSPWTNWALTADFRKISRWEFLPTFVGQMQFWKKSKKTAGSLYDDLNKLTTRLNSLLGLKSSEIICTKIRTYIL